ncbi:MAG: hypothetical protein IJ451_04365 [Ruminococcus sp.]|nr:hypothetical protein [Ruminococcus sp.]
MKRIAKPVSFIIAILILLFSFLSLFGISYYVGDNKHTVIKGFGDIDWGIDTTGATKLVLKNATDDEMDAKALKANTKVIRNRLANFGLNDYEVYFLDDTDEIVVTVPQTIDCDYSSKGFAKLIASKGYVTVRPSDEYTEMVLDESNSGSFVTPFGDTAKSILLDSETVASASYFSYAPEGNEKYHYVNIAFDAQGADALYTMTNSMTGQYYNQVISVWLDDLMIANPTVSEEMTDGQLSVSGVAMTESKAKLYSSIISAGVLPYDMSISSVEFVDPVAGYCVSDIFLIVGIATTALITVLMILRYRVFGGIALVSVVGQVAVLVAIISGFCIPGRTFLMDISGACALALCVVLSVISVSLMAHTLKENLDSGMTVRASAEEAIKSSRKNIFDINVVLIIVGLMGMLMFGSAGLVTALFGGFAVSSIYNFCFVLFFGAVVNFFMGYLFPELMLRSLIGFKALSKPSCYGGKNND